MPNKTVTIYSTDDTLVQTHRGTRAIEIDLEYLTLTMNNQWLMFPVEQIRKIEVQ